MSSHCNCLLCGILVAPAFMNNSFGFEDAFQLEKSAINMEVLLFHLRAHRRTMQPQRPSFLIWSRGLSIFVYVAHPNIIYNKRLATRSSFIIYIVQDAIFASLESRTYVQGTDHQL